MGQNVCLDTDVVIAILNNEERALNVINFIHSSEIFITVITLFELLLRETNLDKIEVFRNHVKILDFDETASRKASLILKELKKTGKIIEFRDLFIASICITNNCELATFNKRHFERIGELNLGDF